MNLFTLWMRLSLFQKGAAISALVLTLGAVIEDWSKLKQLTRLLWRLVLLRSNPFERCVLRKLLIHSVAPIMVIGGIAGELFFETSDFIEENRKAAESDANVRAARREATDGLNAASRRLDTAKKEIDAALLKLQERTEYRHLTADQQRTVSNKMKEFSGTDFIVVIYQSENDAQSLGDEIKRALEGPSGAGWNSIAGLGIGSGAPETGVVIKVKTDATAMTLTIGQKLASALRQEGVFAPPAVRVSKNASAPLNTAAQESPIFVMIERKP
jgi:hypothetical protein